MYISKYFQVIFIFPVISHEQINHVINHYQEWGFDPAKQSTANPATVKYTDFLLATASGKIEGVKAAKLATPFERTKLAAYILGAMIPCMRLCAYLGKEMHVFLESEATHPYKKWIDSYASEGFQVRGLFVPCS